MIILCINLVSLTISSVLVAYNDIQNKNLTLNSIQDWLFGGLFTDSKAKKPPSLNSVTHILQ